MKLQHVWLLRMRHEDPSLEILLQILAKHLLQLGWRLTDLSEGRILARDESVSLTVSCSFKEEDSYTIALLYEESFLARTFGKADHIRRKLLSDKMAAFQRALQGDPHVDRIEDPKRQQELAIRDQTSLAIFYGALIGTDTHDIPEVTSCESLDEALRPKLMSLLDEEQLETPHWGIYRLGYRSGVYPLESIALIHREHVFGEWAFDPSFAQPRNAGHLSLDAATLSTPITLSDEEREELRQLSEALDGLDLLSMCGWQAIALVDLKHF